MAARTHIAATSAFGYKRSASQPLSVGISSDWPRPRTAHRRKRRTCWTGTALLGSAISLGNAAEQEKHFLFYGNCVGRLIGYDNEAGKGDHRRYGTCEEPYHFTAPEQLLEDFLADVRAIRRQG